MPQAKPIEPATPKRALSVAGAAVVLCVGTLAANPGPRVLMADGQAQYALVLPDRPVPLHYPAGETLSYAADFLNSYLTRSCGAELPVLRESAATTRPRRVFIGPTGFAERHVGVLAKLQREELVLQTVGDDIVICGRVTEGVDEGTLFAVYEFCERVLGVRWYFADHIWTWKKFGTGAIVPKSRAVEVPDLTVRDRPAFIQHEGLIRHWGLPEAVARRWHPVLRFGNVREDKTPNHTQGTWYSLYHETHPEYFRKNATGEPVLNPAARGVRNYICFSSPAVLDQMLQNVDQWDTHKTSGLFGFTDKHTPDPAAVYFCPNDGLTPGRVCKCPACRKHLRPDRDFDGQLSELVWGFIRRYALAIDKKWPGRRLSVLAYSCYQQPPTTVDIPPNVDVTLVFRGVTHMHDPAVWDANIGRFDAWRTRLGGHGDRIALWYNIGILNVHSHVPAMYPHTFRRMMQYFQDAGANKHFFCGFNSKLQRPHWPAKQRIVTALLYPLIWIQGQILWNPEGSPDPEALLRQYCQDIHGGAAETMFEYYRFLIERWESSWAGASDLTETDFMYEVKFPPIVCERLKALLAQAESETEEGTAAYKWTRFVARGLSPSFFRELDTHAAAQPQKTQRTICTVTDQSPTVDGRLDEPVWASQTQFGLRRRAWGEPSDRETRIRLLRDATFLYVAAELDAADGQTDFSATELRIHFARQLLKAGEAYAPNIDKAWSEFRELRITADGSTRSYDGLTAEAASATNGTILTVEARVPLAKLPLRPGQQTLPVQFMRYWGVWNRYDTWTPAMTPQVAAYPTGKFGYVVFLRTGRGETRDGLD